MWVLCAVLGYTIQHYDTQFKTNLLRITNINTTQINHRLINIYPLQLFLPRITILLQHRELRYSVIALYCLGPIVLGPIYVPIPWYPRSRLTPNKNNHRMIEKLHFSDTPDRPFLTRGSLTQNQNPIRISLYSRYKLIPLKAHFPHVFCVLVSDSDIPMIVFDTPI